MTSLALVPVFWRQFLPILLRSHVYSLQAWTLASGLILCEWKGNTSICFSPLGVTSGIMGATRRHQRVCFRFKSKLTPSNALKVRATFCANRYRTDAVPTRGAGPGPGHGDKPASR